MDNDKTLEKTYCLELKFVFISNCVGFSTIQYDLFPNIV